MPDPIKLPRLVKRMIAEKQVLCFCNGPEGGRLYWLEPSQRTVGEAGAKRAIASPALIPSNDALLSGVTSQTYRIAPEFA